MKYLLFSWDEIPEIRDLSYIDNKEFEKLAEKYELYTIIKMILRQDLIQNISQHIHTN